MVVATTAVVTGTVPVATIDAATVTGGMAVAGTADVIGVTHTMVGDGAGDSAGVGRITRVGAIPMVTGAIRPIIIPTQLILLLRTIRTPIRTATRTSARQGTRASRTSEATLRRATLPRMTRRQMADGILLPAVTRTAVRDPGERLPLLRHSKRLRPRIPATAICRRAPPRTT